MIEIRDADNQDESWMLQKINERIRDEANFRPRDFRIGINEETEERVAFGRIQYHRNTDGDEFIEIRNFKLLERGDPEHACELLVDLSEQVIDGNNDIVFSISSMPEEIYKEVGFSEIKPEELPDVLEEEYNTRDNLLNSKIKAYKANPWDITFEVPEENEKDIIEDKDEETEFDELVNEFEEKTESTTHKYST